MKNRNAIFICLCFVASLLSPASGAEDPLINDGLTISTYLEALDSTNIIYSENVTGAFTTTNGSQTVRVVHASSVSHLEGAISIVVGTKFSLTGTSATVGGLSMDGTWTISNIVDSTHFEFTHSGTANATVSTPTANTTITYSRANQDGKLRFLCNFSHLAYDDPIVNPGVAGAAHLHLFYGNTTADANSTYATLRAAGNGTCEGGPLNRTAYWMPAMIDGSLRKVRIPIFFEWYYTIGQRRNLANFTSPVCSGSGNLQDGRAAACPQLPAKKIERGMKAIFGFKPSAGTFPSTYVNSGTGLPYANISNNFNAMWTCQDTNGNSAVGSGSYRYLSHRATPSLGITGDANCPSSGRIQVRLNNPSCWDGNHDSADHYIHFAPGGQDGYNNFICPASHPYAFQDFTVIASWSYTGGISSANNWYLSSDRHNGADYEAGETFHWDMWWAWNDTVQEFFHEHVQGMYPSSSAGPPYLYDSAGKDYVGGPYMRNTNNGGLGEDCTALGISGPCKLIARSGGISDILMDIPSLKRRAGGRMR